MTSVLPAKRFPSASGLGLAGPLEGLEGAVSLRTVALGYPFVNCDTFLLNQLLICLFHLLSRLPFGFLAFCHRVLADVLIMPQLFSLSQRFMFSVFTHDLFFFLSLPQERHTEMTAGHPWCCLRWCLCHCLQYSGLRTYHLSVLEITLLSPDLSVSLNQILCYCWCACFLASASWWWAQSYCNCRCLRQDTFLCSPGWCWT
jgi:hypothetical protein